MQISSDSTTLDSLSTGRGGFDHDRGYSGRNSGRFSDRGSGQRNGGSYGHDDYQGSGGRGFNQRQASVYICAFGFEISFTFYRSFDTQVREIRRDNGDREDGKNSRWAGLREDGAPSARWERQQPRDERLESELFAGQLSGINFDKYEEIPVEATGEDVPAPISLFSDLKLHPWIEENIQRSGYNRPTPVQKYSIPALMAGRDLMSCAQTGSGKTAAFLVPVINAILQVSSSLLQKHMYLRKNLQSNNSVFSVLRDPKLPSESPLSFRTSSILSFVWVHQIQLILVICSQTCSQSFTPDCT
ncbi:unnamed protein product [Strongylus vulgaris]|uniref:RNA helicase n=1 Tax=Strongylus vulgaris TaxID=40348 RepID=A0A3P7KRY8_STRVU|nr:unnamed protein product [Strongylus vulgaris]